jgi:chloramphenicol 3-O-phosphotransferase
VLFGGPAGAGKSTLARAWCQTRPLATHVELDEIRHLIISGLADPQEFSDLQEEQYRLSVEAACALARIFAVNGYDVAIDDVFEPDAFTRYWSPQLTNLPWTLVVLLPELEVVLARSAQREKKVIASHTQTQHRRCAEWPSELRIDTTGLSISESLTLVQEHLASRTKRPHP